MKTHHLVFETVLIAFTIIILTTSLYGDGGYAIAVWWAFLGIFQISHAVVIISTYRKTVKIVQYLKLYFFGVALCFVLLGIYKLTQFRITIWDGLIVKITLTMSLLIIPAILALYLWFITWHFRRSSIVEKTV